MSNQVLGSFTIQRLCMRGPIKTYKCEAQENVEWQVNEDMICDGSGRLRSAYTGANVNNVLNGPD